MNPHRLLQRQFDKLDINMEKLPASLEQWEKFLSYVNKSYMEGDQERYLNERSIEISSRELIEINDQLEHAQHLAKLCYWHYTDANHFITWSKGIYPLLHLDILSPPPSFKEFLKRIHPQDFYPLKENIRDAFFKKRDFEFELRIQTESYHYEWFRVITKLGEKEGETSGILMNIHVAKTSEDKINELHRALLSTARLAGMSEVATTILHNIGNILNSANVSVAMLKQNLNLLNHEKLSKIADMLTGIPSSKEYFLTDPKGKLILPYLETLTKLLENQNKANSEEFTRLENNLTHIKDIVAMQQTLSGVSGLREKIKIPELLKNAIEMVNLNKAPLELVQDIPDKNSFIITDKAKMLQILTNLLRNAKQAVMENKEKKAKKIDIRVRKVDETMQFRITDNGIGIVAENLKKIFLFGFTTKKDGHGFGLHSSALSAQELGGSLNAESHGKGKGAKFILILPILDKGFKGETT